MNTCVTCKFYDTSRASGPDELNSLCTSPSIPLSPVTGEPSPLLTNPYIQRSIDDVQFCGYEGRRWEAKADGE